MRSNTKYEVSCTELQRIFDKAKLGAVKKFEPLGAGMYNAVYKVETEDKPYAIKIAPASGVKVMTYEKDMMNTEVLWYRVMGKKTSINVPSIIAVDFSREIIPSDYFIMDYVEGQTLNALNKTEEDKKFAYESMCNNLAQLHKIKSDKFGYIQNGLFDNWYEALKSFIENCISDLKVVNKTSKRGEKLLYYVEKHADLLKSVKGCLVNYDAWDLNIIAARENGELKLTWIDPERGFYGDPILDFICIDILKMSMKGKQKSIDVYNTFTDEKVIADRNTEIRFAFSLGYMALIQETEKYYRYRPVDTGWWFDVLSSFTYYKSCFKLLKA